MSLAIDIDKITHVLLPDGWHEVAWTDDTSTFNVDAYELIWWGTEERRQEGNPIATIQPKGESAGFTFTEKPAGNHVSGPLTSLLATKATP
jgi:hypothetical protein